MGEIAGRYLPSGLLAVAAVVAMAIGRSGVRRSAGAAGFALLGAFLVELVHSLGEGRKAREDRSRRERQDLEDRSRREREDLDETRRLLYMTIYAMPYEGQARISLTGTLVNAIAYHSRLLNPAEAHQLGLRVVGGASDAIAELEKLIQEVTLQLDAC